MHRVPEDGDGRQVVLARQVQQADPFGVRLAQRVAMLAQLPAAVHDLGCGSKKR